MKKIALTIAVVLGMTIGASAQQPFGDNGNRGLFGRGETRDGAAGGDEANAPFLPVHGSTQNEDADYPSPLGSGALLLVGFGAAYALAKKNRK